jgi:hypothetical protein
MKRVRHLFVLMIAAVFLLGTSLGQQADRLSQQSPSQSGEKSADQLKDDVRNDKDQARPKEANENPEQWVDVTRTTTKRRTNASHPKPIPTFRARPAKTPTTNSPRIDAPGRVAAPEQMGAKAASNIPNKAVRRRSPSIPATAVSVNGQQFKNFRNPGARLAISGGPQASARGTAAISGTDIKRKP